MTFELGLDLINSLCLVRPLVSQISIMPVVISALITAFVSDQLIDCITQIFDKLGGISLIDS